MRSGSGESVLYLDGIVVDGDSWCLVAALTAAWRRLPNERRERREIDVAARHDGDDLAAAGAAAERRGHRAAGGALGDDVRALGDEPHRARHLVQRHDDRSGERSAAAATSSRAPTCRRRRPRTTPSSPRSTPARPAASDADSGAAVSGSAAKTRVSGRHARARPRRCPPAGRRRRAARRWRRRPADLRGSRGRRCRCRR